MRPCLSTLARAPQAAKILANLLVAGGTVLFRAATTAYRQAIISELGAAARLLCTSLRLPAVRSRCQTPLLFTLPPCARPPADGTKAGMTAEGVNAARSAAKQLTLREAELILGVEEGASWADILKARCAALGDAVLCCCCAARGAGLTVHRTVPSCCCRRGARRAVLHSQPYRHMPPGLTRPASSLPCPQKYEHLMAANEQSGSFYLQSKVYRCVLAAAPATSAAAGICRGRRAGLLLHPRPLPCPMSRRAKERLEQEFQEQGLPTDPPPGSEQQQQQGGGGQ